MDVLNIQEISQLGGTIVISFAFLWYLNKRDQRHAKTMDHITERLEKLTRVISSLLVKCSKK